MEAIQARLALNPRDSTALEQLGVEYLRRRDFPRAFIELHKALAVDAAKGSSYYYLGLLYYEKGLYFKEIESYEKAILLSPNLLEAHLNLAHAYISVGKIPEAIEQYHWVEGRQPASLPVLFNLGMVFADLDRPEEARRYLTEYLRLAPVDQPARKKAAEVLAETQEHR